MNYNVSKCGTCEQVHGNCPAHKSKLIITREAPHGPEDNLGTFTSTSTIVPGGIHLGSKVATAIKQLLLIQDALQLLGVFMGAKASLLGAT